MADFIAIGVRALSFIAVLQAAGTPMFLWLFGSEMPRSSQTIRRLAARMSVAGLLFAVAQPLVEPARLTGTLSGVLDRSLQVLLLGSDAGTTAAIRIFGLMLVAVSIRSTDRLRAATSLIGATLVVISFAFMGHTAAAGERWLLAPMLNAHLMIVAFWFGALIPLYIMSRAEDRHVSGALIRRFSSIATWLVPFVLIAGIVMAAMLLPRIESLATPYGALLLTKVVVFALLMALASMNKWRLGPGIIRGEMKAVYALQRSVVTEWMLIATVIAVTAVMTAQFSPTH